MHLYSKKITVRLYFFTLNPCTQLSSVPSPHRLSNPEPSGRITQLALQYSRTDKNNSHIFISYLIACARAQSYIFSYMRFHGNKMISIFVDSVLHLIVSIRFFWQCVDCRLKQPGRAAMIIRGFVVQT